METATIAVVQRRILELAVTAGPDGQDRMGLATCRRGSQPYRVLSIGAARVLSCPFCERSARTKEHVWPKWLRKYPAYESMSEGHPGQRFERTEHRLTRDTDNRHREVTASKRHVAEFLPHVQVDVCSNCNNGWMASMEIAVRASSTR
jgi:hypothetical protein